MTPVMNYVIAAVAFAIATLLLFAEPPATSNDGVPTPTTNKTVLCNVPVREEIPRNATHFPCHEVLFAVDDFSIANQTLNETANAYVSGGKQPLVGGGSFRDAVGYELAKTIDAKCNSEMPVTMHGNGFECKGLLIAFVQYDRKHVEPMLDFQSHRCIALLKYSNIGGGVDQFTNCTNSIGAPRNTNTANSTTAVNTDEETAMESYCRHQVLDKYEMTNTSGIHVGGSFTTYLWHGLYSLSYDVRSSLAVTGGDMEMQRVPGIARGQAPYSTSNPGFEYTITRPCNLTGRFHRDLTTTQTFSMFYDFIEMNRQRAMNCEPDANCRRRVVIEQPPIIIERNETRACVASDANNNNAQATDTAASTATSSTTSGVGVGRTIRYILTAVLYAVAIGAVLLLAFPRHRVAGGANNVVTSSSTSSSPAATSPVVLVCDTTEHNGAVADFLQQLHPSIRRYENFQLLRNETWQLPPLNHSKYCGAILVFKFNPGKWFPGLEAFADCWEKLKQAFDQDGKLTAVGVTSENDCGFMRSADGDIVKARHGPFVFTIDQQTRRVVPTTMSEQSRTQIRRRYFDDQQ